MTKSRGILAPRHRWTEAELATLRQFYPDMSTQQVAVLLSLKAGSVYAKANSLGLRKSDAFLSTDRCTRIPRGRAAPRMRATQFEPGHSSWNKGRKGVNYDGMQATQFKPGQKPHTWVPIGSYRISGDGALERKVGDVPGPNHLRWHPVSRLVWEAANGPVPKGHMVIFRPGKKTTVLAEITLDRLELISRAEHARRNHPNSRSPELAQLVQLKGAITRQVNRIRREAEQQQGTHA